MFHSRTSAGIGGSDGPFEGMLLERVTASKPCDSQLTIAALQRELPRLLARPPSTDAVASAKVEEGLLVRALDLTVALAAILFFAPLMVIIAAAIFATSPGPIFFRQKRLGLGGRSFGCLKFRTMRADAEVALVHMLTHDRAAIAEWESSQKLRNDPRISRLGAFLRRTSLDELPQFFNVLAGDMSIVGPRPIVAEEAHRYRRYIRAYYAVKPGITGLWQISGRNQTTYRRRVACDVRYVRSRSVYRDLTIIALTVPVVLLGRGAY